MRTVTCIILAIIGVFCISGLRGDDTHPSGLLIRDIERDIDVTTQVAKHAIEMNVANTGSQFVSSFEVSVLQADKDLALISATAFGEKLRLVGVQKDLTHDEQNYDLYIYDLGKVIAPQDSFDITVNLQYANGMTHEPAEILQNQHGVVAYTDSHLFFTPYEVMNQKTEVHFPGSVEDHTPLDPTSLKGNTLTYGPYADIEPLSMSSMDLLFTNNGPFVKVTKLTKVITISHWGSVEVVEQYELKNVGAGLKGGYSRNQRANPTMLAGVKQTLPVKLFNLWFRDEIGNISTAQVYLEDVEETGSFTIELSPRYPLIGGWGSSFSFGYSLFAEDYLRQSLNDKSSFYFNNTLFNYFEDDLVVDELEIRVVLPAGASGAQLHTDADVESSIESSKGVLDLVGRQVVVLNKKNFVREYAGEFFQVSYSFNPVTGFFQKPLLLVVLFAGAFAVMIVLFATATEESKEEEKTRAGIQDLLADLKEQHEFLCDHFANLLQATCKYAKSKKSQLKTEQAKYRNNISQVDTEILKIIHGISILDEEAGVQARAVRRKEQDKYGYLNQLIENEIKYRNKYIVKVVYEQTKSQTQNNYNDIDEELDRLIADLTEDIPLRS